ncbi:CXXX repeat peptide modification system protein [Bariatricus sp. SGI.154]|uniref:CXXX repeat peptide modification system protein n=1 Tax=Bariatricus sp. SGI.154 TaxID=3420549 RepID=UPI003CFE2120
MRRLGKIEEKECKEGLKLLEKKNALHNLQMILEENELFKRCQKEYEMVIQNYNQWWEIIIDKYYGTCSEGENFMVDFAKGELYLK